MKYNILIMLLSVLCLFGCSSENEPQSVAFSISEYRFDKNGGQVTVNVIANCAWTISGSAQGLHVDLKSGEGNVPILLEAIRNDGYDELHCKLTITSEDGTSKSTLDIYQDMSYGLLVNDVKDTIPAEGGNFSLPLSTNEKIVQVETPDWMTYTSARALTDYQYSFDVKPNKDGKPRSGNIIIKSSIEEKTVAVTQDSFTPESVRLTQDISWTTEHELSIPLSVTPEYADLSKINIKATDNIKSAYIEDGRLYIYFAEYGKFNISLTANSKELIKTNGEYLPPYPLVPSKPIEVLLGTKMELNYLYYSEDYIISSSNENVLKIVDRTHYETQGIGTSTITVRHPQANTCSELVVNVVPFVLEFGAEQCQKINGTNDYIVNFSAKAVAWNNITSFLDFKVMYDSRIIMQNQGRINISGKTLTLNTNDLTCSVSDSDNIRYLLSEYCTLYLTVKINETEYTRSARLTYIK